MLTLRQTVSALAWALLLPVATQGVRAATLDVLYIGQLILPANTQFEGTTVGGLTSLDYDSATDTYYAMSSDRSQVNPARFYNLSLDLSQFTKSAKPTTKGVKINRVTKLLTPTGTPFAANTVAPGGLRYDPDRDTLYWTDLGQRNAAGVRPSTVREMKLDGSYVRDFALPSYYKPSGSPAGLAKGDLGISDGGGIKGLTIYSKRDSIFIGTQGALVQDGQAATTTFGSRARLMSFDLKTGQPGIEYAYDVSPVVNEPRPAKGTAINQMTDLVSIGDREFLSVERSYSAGAKTPGKPSTGNTVRLFHVDMNPATDVQGRASMAGDTSVVRLDKQFVMDLSTMRNADKSPLSLGNIRGIALGPMLKDEPTLILVADNEMDGQKVTQFIALHVVLVREQSLEQPSPTNNITTPPKVAPAKARKPRAKR
jgi:hypothetical protein